LKEAVQTDSSAVPPAFAVTRALSRCHERSSRS
jgi:hypothetical protein